MAAIEFETLITTHMRDTGGRMLKVLTVTGISGGYTAGGVEITPQELGFGSVDYISLQGLFAASIDGTMTKLVDLHCTKVVVDGAEVWKLIVFLYQIDGAELPDGTEMLFVPEYPITLIAIGSRDRR